MNPTISIIVPIYNQEKYLRRCLDSILAQTFTDFEIICVNDHSTDSTAEILNEYAAKNSRIVVLDDPGKGVSDARNFGIENAKGEYIGFVDSDDFIQPQMYEFMLRAIKENGCDMVVCEYKRSDTFVPVFFDYSCKPFVISEYAGDAFHWGKDEMVLSGVWSKLIKADFLKETARFKKYRIGEDTVFCAELWTNTSGSVLIDLPLYGYFTNQESACNNRDESYYINLFKSRYAAFRIYNKKYTDIAQYFLQKSFMLISRCRTEHLVEKKENKRILLKYFRKMFIPFLKSNNLTLKEKIFYIYSCLGK